MLSTGEQQGGTRGWRQLQGGSSSILLPAEQGPCREPGDAACPWLQASCSPFPPHAATKVPCPGPSSHKSPRAPSSSLQRGTMYPPYPLATTVPQLAQAGLGGGMAEALGWAGSCRLARAEEDDGAAAEAGELGPRQALDAGRHGSARGARGEEPTQLLLRWSRGAPGLTGS